MKLNLLLFTLFLILLFFYPKNDIHLGPMPIAENATASLQNLSADPNPFLEITGTIEKYKNGEATVTENSFWTGEKTTIGTIDNSGTFTIPLDQDFFSTVKKKMAAAEKDVPKGGVINYQRVNTIFTCGSEGFGYKNTTKNINDSISVINYPRYAETNHTTFKNGESIILKLPLLNLTDKKGDSHSLLYAASSPEVAAWMRSSGVGDINTGYYLEWIFVENAATVQGVCAIPTSTKNGEGYTNTTNTDLELQAGWNIIKHDITDVYTSTEGQTKAEMTRISVISELPKDLKWFAINQEY